MYTVLNKRQTLGRERGDHFEDTGWDKIKTIGWKTGELKINLQVYDYSFQSLR